MLHRPTRWRPSAGAEVVVLLDEGPDAGRSAQFALVFADYAESRGAPLRIVRVRRRGSEACMSSAVLDVVLPGPARALGDEDLPALLAALDRAQLGPGQGAAVVVGGELHVRLCIALRDALEAGGTAARAVLALARSSEHRASQPPPLDALDGVLAGDPVAELLAQTQVLDAAAAERAWQRSFSAWMAWPCEERGWRRTHILSHALEHHVKAGRHEAALELCRSLDYLACSRRLAPAPNTDPSTDPSTGPSTAPQLRAGLSMLLGELGHRLEPEQRERIAQLERALFVVAPSRARVVERLWNAMLGECRDIAAVRRWFGSAPAGPLRLRHPLHLPMYGRALLRAGEAITSLAVGDSGELALGTGQGGRRSSLASWFCAPPAPEFEGMHITALAWARGHFISGGDHLRIWAREAGAGGRELERARTGSGAFAQVRALAVAGETLHVGYEDGWIETWNLAEERRIARRQLGSGSAIEFIADAGGGQLALGDGTDVFDLPSRGDRWRHQGCVTTLLALPEHDLIVCGDNQGALYEWAPHSHARGREFIGHSARINALLVSAEGWLVSASDDRSVRVWDPQTGAQLACLRGHAGAVTALALGPEGTLFTGGAEGVLRAWAPASPASAATAGAPPYLAGRGAAGEAHLGPMRGLAWADADTLVTAAADGSLCVWDAPTGELRSRTWAMSMDAAPDELQGLVRSASGLFAAPTAHAGIRVFAWEQGRLRAHRHPIVAAEGDAFVTGFCQGPEELVVASDLHGKLRVWDVHTREQILCLPCPGEPPLRHASMPSGMIATASQQRLWLWDPRSGETLADTALDGESPVWLTAGPDGRVISLAGAGRGALRWDPATGRIERSAYAFARSSQLVARADGLLIGIAGAELFAWRWGWREAKSLSRGELPYTCLLLRGDELVAGDALGNPHFFDADWARIEG